MMDIEWIPQADIYSKFRLKTKARDFIFITPDPVLSTAWCSYFMKFIPKSQNNYNNPRPVPILQCAARIEKRIQKSWFVICQDSLYIFDKKQDWEYPMPILELNYQEFTFIQTGSKEIQLKVKERILNLTFDSILDKEKFLNYLLTRIQPTEDGILDQMDVQNVSNIKDLIYSEMSNRFCADCSDGPEDGMNDDIPYAEMKDLPDWFAPHFGVILCSKCAGVHRKIRRLDSISLDLKVWQRPERLNYVSYFSNSEVNTFWEYLKPEKIRKTSSDSDRKTFIFSKYEEKTFCNREETKKSIDCLNKELWKSIKNLNIFETFKLLNLGACTSYKIPEYNNISIREKFNEFDQQLPVVIAMKELLQIFANSAANNSVNKTPAIVSLRNPWNSNELFENRHLQLSCMYETREIIHESNGRVIENVNMDSAIVEKRFSLLYPEKHDLFLVIDNENIRLDYTKLNLAIQFPTGQGELQTQWLDNLIRTNSKLKTDKSFFANLYKCQNSFKSGCVLFGSREKSSFGSEDCKNNSGHLDYIIDVRLKGPVEETELWIDTFTRLFCPKLLLDEDFPRPKRFTAAGWIIIREYLTGEWSPKWAILIDRVLYTIPFEGFDRKNKVYWNEKDLLKKIKHDQSDLPTDPTTIGIYDLRMMTKICYDENIERCEFRYNGKRSIHLSLPERSLYIITENQTSLKAWYHLFKDIYDLVGPCLADQILTTKYVPLGLDEAIKWLDVYAVSCCDGLYRKNGVLRHVNACYSNMVKCPRTLLNNEDYELSPHVVCGAIKKYIAKIPTTLMSDKFPQEAWFNYLNMDNETDQRSYIKKLLKKIPLINYSTLRRLVIHLNAIARNSEITLMNIDNLANVLGQTIFYNCESDDESKVFDSRNSVLLKFLLENFLYLFDISEEEHRREIKLQNQAALINQDQSSLSNIDRRKSVLKNCLTNEEIFVTIYLRGRNQGDSFERVIIKPKMTVLELLNYIKSRFYTNVRISKMTLSESLSGNLLQRPLGERTNLCLLVKSWQNLDQENRKSAHLAVDVQESMDDPLDRFDHVTYFNSKLIRSEIQIKVKIIDSKKKTETSKTLLNHAQKLLQKSRKSHETKEQSSRIQAEEGFIKVDMSTGLLHVCYLLKMDNSFTWPIPYISFYNGIEGKYISSSVRHEHRKTKSLTSSLPSGLDDDQEMLSYHYYEPYANSLTLIPPPPEMIIDFRMERSVTSLGLIDSNDYTENISENGILGPGILFEEEKEFVLFKLLLKTFWLHRLHMRDRDCVNQRLLSPMKKSNEDLSKPMPSARPRNKTSA